MNHDQDERIIRRLLLDMAQEDFAQELDTDQQVPTSRRFQRQMRRMLADPEAWARSRRRPLWQKGLRTAAMVALTCSLTLGAIAGAPRAYASILEWAAGIYEGHIFYGFAGTPTVGPMPEFEIGSLPAGYRQVSTDEVPNIMEIQYENDAGQRLLFEYMRVQDGTGLNISTEDMDVEEVLVNGHEGHLYISNNERQSSAIAWYDSTEKLQFWIDGFVDADTLLKAAESVKKIK